MGEARSGMRHRFRRLNIILVPVCRSRFRRVAFSAILAVCALMVSTGCSRKKNTPPLDGAALFAHECANCHKPDNDMRAPEPEALRQMSKASILTALESGRMKWEGKRLSKAKKEAIAGYLGLAEPSTSAAITGYCARDLDPPPNPPVWSG